MRALTLLAALAFAITASAETKPFGTYCAYGLAAKDQMVQTDCSINWTDTASKNTYCFSSEEAKKEFAKDWPKHTQMAATNFAKHETSRGMMKAQEAMNEAQKQMKQSQDMMKNMGQ